jgi:WD40 repeat protein/serine/threonine protein kinase
MSRTEPNGRIEWIIRQAQLRSPAERAAFLDGACAGDLALRRRLEALLAAQDQPDPLQATPAAASRATVKVECLSDRPDEAVGQTLGRYKLLERVGEGGWGVVYVAEQTEPLRRRVALKVIKLGMDTKQVVARFEAERQALAMMDHPNIAKVLDAGSTEQGRPYFVMELVRGIRITDYCDQNNLSTPARLDLFIQVCHAIQHAHQKGIIHRDIKPSNILVTLHDGLPVPKVIDFGIAKAAEGRLTDATVYTHLNQFIGTPAYMSPEQAEMGGLDIDTRSDIYSLGVLLYELLVGRTPFDAKELLASGIEAMCKTIRDKEPLRPSTKLATLQGEELTTTAKRRSVEPSKLIYQLKGDLDWIVMKCLEKDRTRRYETANGVAADLKRHLNNEPVVAGAPSTIYRLKKFIVRNKWPMVLNATVAALTVAGLIGTSLGLRRATMARRQADQNAARAEQNARRAGQLANQAKHAEIAARLAETNALHLAYSASMLSACDALEHWQIDSARHYLDTAPADLRGWEWRHLFSRLDLSVRTHDHSRSNVSMIHVAPDGRSYYELSVSPAQGIRRWDTDTGQLLATLPATHSYGGSWLVAGGKQLIAQINEGRPGPVEVWDLERATRLCSFPAADNVQAAPDGSCFACVHEQKLQIVDTRSGATRVSPTTVTSSFAVHTMCFQPDGRRLAVCSTLGDVALLDTASLEFLSTFKAHENTIASMAFRADSRWLATGSLDNTIRITDVAANPPAAVATLRGHAGPILALCFSPDGSLLAACGADRILCLWDTRTMSLRGMFDSGGVDPSFLPDGQTLINGQADGVRFWDVRSLDACVLRGHRSFVYSVLLSPDGATIYSGGWDGYFGQPGSLRFWDAATGDLIAATGATNEYVRAPAALSVDGSRLAVSVRAANESFNRIDILDTVTGRPVASVHDWGDKASVPMIDSLTFDPAAQHVFCVDTRDGVARLVDARTGLIRKSRQMSGGGPIGARVAWSPDGATIAVGYGNEGGGVDLLDPQSLELVRRWPHGHGGFLTSVAFSPDSRRILTASQDQIVRVWDAATGTRLHDLVGHGNIVFCAAYSPDGKRIASGGRDNNVRIWDAETFHPVARLGGHEDYIYSLAWRADSQQLLSGSGDHTVRIWDTVPIKDRMQARRERQAILAQVEPTVQRLFAEFGDAGKVVEKVKADVSLSARARQVALQVVLRTSLDRQNTAAPQLHP